MPQTDSLSRYFGALSDLGYGGAGAVTDFQRDHDLKPDGIIGPKTAGTLNSVHARWFSPIPQDSPFNQREETRARAHSSVPGVPRRRPMVIDGARAGGHSTSAPLSTGLATGARANASTSATPAARRPPPMSPIATGTAARPADVTSAARRKLRTTAERTLAGSTLPTSGRGAAAAPGSLLGLGLPSATSGSGLGTAVGKAPARPTKVAPGARDPKMLSDAELAQEATRLKATLDADRDRYWQEGLHERYGRILQEQGQRGQAGGTAGSLKDAGVGKPSDLRRLTDQALMQRLGTLLRSGPAEPGSARADDITAVIDEQEKRKRGLSWHLPETVPGADDPAVSDVDRPGSLSEDRGQIVPADWTAEDEQTTATFAEAAEADADQAAEFLAELPPDQQERVIRGLAERDIQEISRNAAAEGARRAAFTAVTDTVAAARALVDTAIAAVYGRDEVEIGPDGREIRRHVPADEVRREILQAVADGTVATVLGLPEIPGQIVEYLKAVESQETILAPAIEASLRVGTLSRRTAEWLLAGINERRTGDVAAAVGLIMPGGLLAKVGRHGLLGGRKHRSDLDQWEFRDNPPLEPADLRFRTDDINTVRKRELEIIDERRAHFDQLGKYVPNVGGRRGGPDHISTILDTQQGLALNRGLSHIAGGTRKEATFRLVHKLNGKAVTLSPDLVFLIRGRYGQGDTAVFFEVGATNKRLDTQGNFVPVRRERRKVDKAELVGSILIRDYDLSEFIVKYVPYDK